MKKILISFLFILLLSSCQPSSYIIVSVEPVDGYYIYYKEQNGILCNTYWEDIFYSGEIYNYGYSFKGCSANMSYFIKTGDSEYIYLRDALDLEYITLDSLIPELMMLERNPEIIESDEADYYWLDFHIDGKVVYAYAGGECDQNGSETFIIDNTTYTYNASGCLKDNILFMRIDGTDIPVETLLSDGSIDGEYLIPLLVKSIE
ncbi:hypothetical protein KQ51_01712 [Candidatus Izimaplasma bacterium HR1]|jgi:hypothetical protein|uniref:hypothetical protein n=1 Tax=Candidatus Izimoplasma sp. HR1 TaxID=1541959 RepID=UPI0004F6C468|nr:hypothetical protein KQ51_01712 [Candidatus Izimaplasma bacterium HR1]